VQHNAITKNISGNLGIQRAIKGQSNFPEILQFAGMPKPQAMFQSEILKRQSMA
jgi:hypothetical protein